MDAQVAMWKQPDRRGDGEATYSAAHPAGEIDLGGRSLIATRTAALAGGHQGNATAWFTWWCRFLTSSLDE